MLSDSLTSVLLYCMAWFIQADNYVSALLCCTANDPSRLTVWYPSRFVAQIMTHPGWWYSIAPTPVARLMTHPGWWYSIAPTPVARLMTHPGWWYSIPPTLLHGQWPIQGDGMASQLLCLTVNDPFRLMVWHPTYSAARLMTHPGWWCSIPPTLLHGQWPIQADGIASHLLLLHG